MYLNRLRANIKINYIYTVFFNINLTKGLWMIYLAGRGFTLMQLGILEGFFHLTSFLMEVPTGAAADIWGRKASKLCGRIFMLISLIIMFASDSFIMQIIGFFICATGFNLESGAGEALLYDSMLLIGEKDNYLKAAGVQELLYQASLIISYTLGGYLAAESYTPVFLISMLFVIFSFITGLFFYRATDRKNHSTHKAKNFSA